MKRLTPKRATVSLVVHRETLRELSRAEVTCAIGGVPRLVAAGDSAFDCNLNVLAQLAQS